MILERELVKLGSLAKWLAAPCDLSAGNEPDASGDDGILTWSQAAPSAADQGQEPRAVALSAGWQCRHGRSRDSDKSLWNVKGKPAVVAESGSELRCRRRFVLLWRLTLYDCNRMQVVRVWVQVRAV